MALRLGSRLCQQFQCYRCMPLLASLGYRTELIPSRKLAFSIANSHEANSGQWLGVVHL
ncbi:hypothetical protein OIDMADRAFT_17729, partial [Oidiodendron maius Zn]